MNSKILASFLLIVYFVSESYGRDLLVEVKGGKVRKKDTFSTDPYMSVTVCNEKKQTQVVKNNVNPVWNWSNTFRNVRDDCRLKFHLYDEDTGADDSIGELEQKVGEFLRERAEESTLILGKAGDSQIKIRVKYTDNVNNPCRPGFGNPAQVSPPPRRSG